jgi:hypothetical protein
MSRGPAASRAGAPAPRAAAAPAATPSWLLYVALAATLAGVAMRLWAAWVAGPLWRDEAHSASTAAVRTFGEFFARLPFDSFPLLWQLLLRSWIAIWGDGDQAIRVLGALVSLLLLPALWWTSRALGIVPLASLLFAAVAPTYVVWAGIANRAYGLGVALLAVLVGAMWRLARDPAPRNVALAAVVALLAVHTLYHNSVALAALVGAAAVIGWRRGESRVAVSAIGVGVVSALSLAIYAGVFRRTAELAKLVYTQVTLGGIADGMRDAIAPGGAWLPYAFALLAIAACAFGLVSTLRSAAASRSADAGMDDGDRDAVLFVSCAALLALVGQAVFLLRLRFFVQPWYYVTVILIAAIAIDVVVQRGLPSRALRQAAAAVLAVLIAASGFSAFGAIDRRQSNIDLAAAYLQANARPGDLIVVYPWHFGVSFDRYYRGSVPFMTIPAVENHDFHRFDQLADLMRDPEQIKPGFKRIYDTLAAGNGVWVVGRPQNEVLPTFPVPVAPRDDDPSTWREGFYTALAGLQLAYVLNKQSPQVQALPPLTAERVNEYEDASITLYTLRAR